MSEINKLVELPPDLPVPLDDGACTHLLGARLPRLGLPSTTGEVTDLAAVPGRLVLFFYPRTGRPGLAPLIPNWNEIPGARGCTPQTTAFRDLHDDFTQNRCRLYGISAQATDYQQELVGRLRLPFPILSDHQLALTHAMSLPTFEAAGQILLKRMAWVVDNGKIVKVFYPVFPPDANATEVLAWMRTHPFVE